MSYASEFGAVADGVADDTQALQRTVDEGDGVLALSPGTYRITAPIVLDTTRRGYVGVHGAQGASRFVMEGAGPALRVVGNHGGTADPKTVNPRTWDGERFPILEGFEVLGAHEEADGIELVRTMQATVRAVLIRKCRYGVHLVDRSRNFVLAHSHIYDCLDTGLFFDRLSLHQANIFGNHISYCRRAGIRQFNGDLHNIQITGNDIEYNFGHEASSGEIVLEAPDSGLISEYTIASNTIQAKPEAHGANILILGRDEGEVRDASDGWAHSVGLIAITGNVIGSRDKTIAIDSGALSLTIVGNTIYGGMACNVHLKKCRGAVVGSNTVLPMGAVAYRSRPKGGILLEDCNDCQITGNVVNDHPSGEEEAGGSITLRRCANVMVSGCQIARPGVRGIYLDSVTQCTVAANAIIDDAEPRTMLAAIEFTGEGSGNVVQHNTLTAGSRGTIVCDESQGTVLNNIVQ